MPLLSIITINYNNCAGLQKTMESVFTQTFKDYEYIVIDGGSTDGSKEYLLQHKERLSYFISEKDNGIYDAMNKGVKEASGDFIMFLNSADYLVQESVLGKAQKYIENKKAEIYYGNIEIKNEQETIERVTYPAELTLDFLENSTINHQASFIRSSLFKELGSYDTTYNQAADYAFYLKCFFYGKSFQYINEVLVHYRLDGVSNLHNNAYKIEMKAAWKNIIPLYIDTLYEEHKTNSLLMQHRAMQWAKKINRYYHIIRSALIK